MLANELAEIRTKPREGGDNSKAELICPPAWKTTKQSPTPLHQWASLCI